MPNTPARSKYLSYTFAFDEMRRASEQGFPLHAIAIAESILSDRILSFLLSHGEAVPVKATFATLLTKLEPHLKGKEKFTFADLDAFRLQRNEVLHAIAKSLPGAAPMKVEDFRAAAKLAADNGRRLARQVSDWVKAQKRQDARDTRRPR